MSYWNGKHIIGVNGKKIAFKLCSDYYIADLIRDYYEKFIDAYKSCDDINPDFQEYQCGQATHELLNICFIPGWPRKKVIDKYEAWVKKYDLERFRPVFK